MEPFRYCTNLAAKRTKLVQFMQKFRPRCLVKFFCNERSRSTLLDPKIMFWSIFSDRVHFGPFRYCTKLGAKRAKLVQLMQNFMPRFRAWFFRNERSRSTPLDPKLMFWCVSFRSGAFWNSFATTRNLVQNAPNCTLMQKFVQQCLLRFFRNEHCRSTPLDPKLIFRCISFRLGAFGTISLLHETRCKMGQLGAINARVRATKSHQNFSKRMLPIHTIGL